MFILVGTQDRAQEALELVSFFVFVCFRVMLGLARIFFSFFFFFFHFLLFVCPCLAFGF
jgi:hypothetical protein